MNMKYKLVPVEPTPEMRRKAGLIRGADYYTISKVWRAMIDAAPAVQGEPLAWVTVDTVDGQAVNGKPRRIWWENKEGVGMPIYTAPQPTEQHSSSECPGAGCMDQGCPAHYADSTNLITTESAKVAKLDTNIVTPEREEIEKLVEALEGLLSIVDESDGVSGYHLNGAVAKWGEFEWVAMAKEALDLYHQKREEL